MEIPSAHLPTRFGDFEIKIFTDGKKDQHIVLTKGDVADGLLLRIHSECATGDVLGSLRCDCRDQLERSLERINTEGGMLIYLHGQEGRGIGLAEKIRAYALQEKGADTVDANIQLGHAPDERDYQAAIDILKHFGVKKLRLLTNNHDKIKALQEAGIAVSEHVPLWTATNPHNEKYIATKRERMGHMD
jgi:GTP cyclohydrolase II